MKRLLLFLALLAVGVVAMRIAIGDEDAVRANGHEKEDKQERQPDGPGGVKITPGHGGPRLKQSGPLDITRWDEVPLPDGRIKKHELYVLKTKDSQPIGDGLQELTDVTLKLFDHGVHTATVFAQKAFVQLGRDANGDPAFDEKKEIDLREAVIVTEEASKVAGMRLELGDARINVGENEVQLTTSRDQPVKLTIAGDRPATLTGVGATARIPRNKEGGLQTSSIDILKNPVLEADGMRVEATGRMHYVENIVSGTAQITVDDNVQLDLDDTNLSLAGLAHSKARDGEQVRSSVKGDQFTGWLVRHRTEDDSGKESQSMVWQRLLLVGAPATIDLPGIHVDTPRLSVLPGPLGDPFVVTAHGGESRVQQTELRAGSKQTDLVVGVSPRRIHMIRPVDAFGALHRRMGFPRWTLRSLEQQQVVVFEGDARLESGARTLQAKEGFLVMRRSDQETGVVRGFGAVTVRQRSEREGEPDMIASGSDGLMLIVTPDGERMHLGPSPEDRTGRWRDHRYDVRHGKTHLRGVGTCAITNSKTADKQSRTTLSLRAPFDEIEADFAEEGTELRKVRQLDATLIGQNVTELDVAGLPVEATLTRAGERVITRAPRLLQIDSRSMRLLPMPFDVAPWSELDEIARTPRLVRTWKQSDKNDEQVEYTVEVVGPHIDVHHAGGQNVLIDAQEVEGDLPRVYARLPQAGATEPTTVTCAAERLRILPFALSPEVQRVHLGGMQGPLADTILHSLSKPWLLVDRVKDFQLDDEKEGHIEGSGERLFLSQGGAAALFVGNPDTQTPATVTRTQAGNTVAMQGARVRVYRDTDVRLAALGSFDGRSTFLAPTMTLHDEGQKGLLSHMRAVCRGNIQVDPDAVRFGGPVVATAIKPDGSDDADGMQIEAEQLEMLRRKSTRQVVKVIGQNVKIDWTRLDAEARQITLDLLLHLCTARDPNGANVALPSGQKIRSRFIEVNYDTWSISMGHSLAVQESTSQDGDK